MILGCSQAPPASVDVLSPSIFTRRGPESDLTGGREMTPAGALKLPLPGGNRPKDILKTGLLGVLALDLGRRPRPPLPRGALPEPGSSRCQGCSRRAPGDQRPLSFKGDAA